MRLAPVAIRWQHNPEKAEAVARRQSLTTHAAAEAVDACELFARILVNAINGKGHDAIRVPDIDPDWQPSIKAIVGGCWRGKAEADIRSTGYVVDTLEAALWAVAGTTCFKDAILKAANLGHDADTVAAVAGQIAGAIYGVGRILDQWIHRLYRGAEIHELGKELFLAGIVNLTPDRHSCRKRCPQARPDQPTRAVPVASRQEMKAQPRATRYSLAERR